MNVKYIITIIIGLALHSPAHAILHKLAATAKKAAPIACITVPPIIVIAALLKKPVPTKIGQTNPNGAYVSMMKSRG